MLYVKILIYPSMSNKKYTGMYYHHMYTSYTVNQHELIWMVCLSLHKISSLMLSPQGGSVLQGVIVSLHSAKSCVNVNVKKSHVH